MKRSRLRAKRRRVRRGLAVPALRLWWFETRLRRHAPDDIAAFAAGLGFADAHAFDLALYRERLFLELHKDSS